MELIDRVRVSWGRVQNFKCVDYFQIEYWNEEDPEGSFDKSEIINRHRTSHDITIAPCRSDTELVLIIILNYKRLCPSVCV